MFHVSFHAIAMNFCLVAMHLNTSMAPTPDPVQPVLLYFAVAQRACRVPHHHATATRITHTATVAHNGRTTVAEEADVRGATYLEVTYHNLGVPVSRNVKPTMDRCFVRTLTHDGDGARNAYRVAFVSLIVLEGGYNVMTFLNKEVLRRFGRFLFKKVV